MARLLPVCRILLESQNEATEAALLEALPLVADQEVPHVVAVLLRRGQPEGLRGIVSGFHRFSVAVQTSILTHADALYSALNTALRTPDPQVRMNAIQIIVRGDAWRTTALLGPVLTDSSHRVREQGAGALYQLAERFYRNQTAAFETLAARVETGEITATAANGQVCALVENRKRLLTALEEALDSFDRHHRTEILEPIMWFIAPMSASVWPRVSVPRNRAGRAMTEAVSRLSDPRLARFSLHALAYAELRAVAGHTIGTTRNDAFFCEIIRQAWIEAEPRGRAALGRLRDVAWIRANCDKIVAMPETMQRKAVRLLAASGTPVDAKVAMLHQLLRTGAAGLPRLALWALVEIDSESATRALQGMANSKDDALAAVACRELRRRGVAATPVRPQASAPVRPRGATEDEPAPPPVASFETFWDQFDDLDENQRHQMLRQLAQGGVNVKSQLRKRMTAGSAPEQVRAITLAAQCGLIDAYRTEIYHRAHDPDVLVRATAISTLALLPGPTSERMLRAALSDQDQRVQANAIEAIDVVGGTDEIRLLQPKLDADNNRVRANAVHVLLKRKVREAATSLLEMLNHPNRGFRLSAVWLARQMQLRTLLPRIEAMAQTDPDPQVRRRAEEAIVDLTSAQKAPAPPAAGEEAVS